MSIKNYRLVLISALLIAFVFVRLVIWSGSHQQAKDGEQVNLKGYLTQEPTVKNGTSRLSFQGYQVFTRETDLHYGDNLAVSGKIKNGYLSFPRVERLEETNLFYKILKNIRSKSAEGIKKALPEPEAGLMMGIVLGDKSDLIPSFEDDLKTTGTIHVAVVSGFNISLVGGALLGLSKFINRRRAAILASVVIVLYSLLVGFTPPTWRAVLMGLSAYLATLTGRLVYPFFSLALSAFLLFLIDPTVLGDVGFQLSFLATAGILLFSTDLEVNLRFLPKFFRSDFITSIAAQLLCLPILFYNFGKISIFAVFVNGLTLWTIPIATILGFAMVCASLIAFPFVYLVGAAAYLPTAFFVLMVKSFAALPFSTLNLGKGNLFLVAGYYLIVISISFEYLKRIYGRKNA